MQIKKQEVEDAIMAQAELEFYAHGFEHASIRHIIRTAGVSIGNFYNYFENKEALFNAIVCEEYQLFMRFMTQQEHEDDSFFKPELLKDPDWKAKLPDLLSKRLPGIVSGMLPDFTMRFVILIEGSRGTRYENTGNRLIKLVKDHLMQHVRETGASLPDDHCELLAQQFLDGLIRIIKLHINDQQARNRLLTHFLVFYMMGVAGSLGMN